MSTRYSPHRVGLVSDSEAALALLAAIMHGIKTDNERMAWLHDRMPRTAALVATNLHWTVLHRTLDGL